MMYYQNYNDVLVCRTLQSYMTLYLWVVIESAGGAGPLACGRIWRERIGSGLLLHQDGLGGPRGRILVAQPSSAARIIILVLPPETRTILHVITKIADITIQSD